MIDAVLRGETRCFAPLVDKYKDMVFATVSRMLPSREDAEDLTQEVFVKAYMGLSRFKRDSKFSTWLFRIAYNEAVSMYHAPSLDTTGIEPWTQDEEEQEMQMSSSLQGMASQERLHYIQQAMDRMDRKNAVILTLYYLNEHTVAEISDICDISQSNVKVILHRARVQMKRILEQMLGVDAAEKLL